MIHFIQADGQRARYKNKHGTPQQAFPECVYYGGTTTTFEILLHFTLIYDKLEQDPHRFGNSGACLLQVRNRRWRYGGLAEWELFWRSPTYFEAHTHKHIHTPPAGGAVGGKP